MDHIVEGQVVQEATDRFRVHVIGDQSFDHGDEAEVVARMKQRLGDVDVRVVLVDEIPRSAGGKFRAVVSELKDSAAPGDVPAY